MTDPFDRFRVMNPFVDDHVDVELDERDTELLYRIMQQPVEDSEALVSVGDPHDLEPVVRIPVRAARSRRPVWLVAAAVVTGALATAAFAVLRTERATVPNAVACHSAADTESDVVGLRGSADPIAACAEVWALGDFGGDGTVPPLTACVNSGGAASVFPGDDGVCEKLGLARLVPGFTEVQQAIVDLEERLADVFLESCFEQEAAVAEAERQLVALGLTDWTVRVAEEFPVGAECAGPGVLAGERVVIVVGVRPR